ncbi:hypothetical protein GWI33_008081 [Rhynchophorus ferrugineus]|uniref:Uncharacterized protein n=1 Tax=Rhynchophorus ferrugineus TaxID=354439 RepID=A0A834IF80_RHYFE|nr:hypothetical protein GWI33_008081 [Rhynchophorus ferrugineus]
MRFIPTLCVLVLVALCGASPAKRQRSAPRAYMIGYYASPRYARQEAPEALEEPLPEADVPQEPEAEPQQDAVEEQEAPAEPETTESVALAAAEPAAEPSADPAEAPAEEAAPSAEDEAPETLAAPAPAASWPFGGAGRGQASYNAFFPIFIAGNSGSDRGRSANGEEGGSGSATAIANSFSTGKNSVASSHATSFGDPYAAAALRNAGLFNPSADA